MPERYTSQGEFGGDILYERENRGNAPVPPASRRRGRLFAWGGAAVVVIIAGLLLSGTLRGATITVSAKRMPLSLNAEFTAARKTTEGLQFNALPLSASAEEVIPADQMKNVSEHSSGTIVIYNNYSKDSQRLIKNTRFENPKGLIYRIDHSIVIPGKTVQDGKTIPGSVESVVYADSPGEEYNSAPVDFSIPGFKNDANRFAAFYARSKTPLSGGVDGMMRMPSDEAVAAARQRIRERLQNDIKAQAKNAATADSILYDDALVFTFDSLPLEARGSDKSAVRERVTGVAYLFDRHALAKAIAQKAVRGYNGLPVAIAELDRFDFSFVPPLPSATSETIDLKFTLHGTGEVTWTFAEDALKTALLGKSRDDLAAALSVFPTIEKIDVAIRPFWSRRLPDDPKDITVEKTVGGTPVGSSN